MVTPAWIETAAYCVGLHFLLWDVSPTYRALVLRYWRELRERAHPVKTRLTGILARDVGDALTGGGL